MILTSFVALECLIAIVYEHLHFAACGAVAVQQSCQYTVTHLINLFDNMYLMVFKKKC